MFGKKKKSPEEVKREKEERIKKVENDLELQVVSLEKKQAALFEKVIEARKKGLSAQEKQARGLLKQTMASVKRAQGMLLTIQLAVQSRDLARLNVDFLKSVGDISDEIVSAGRETPDVKKVEDKYARAMYETQRQMESIDDMISVGAYASAAAFGDDTYNEYDSEIDAMLESAGYSAAIPGDGTKGAV